MNYLFNPTLGPVIGVVTLILGASKVYTSFSGAGGVSKFGLLFGLAVVAVGFFIIKTARANKQ